MLISADSPLVRLPAGLDSIQVRFLDAIRLTIDALDLTYSRLSRSLQQLGPIAEDRDRAIVASTIHDAWSMVDATHRLRLLVENMPRYKGRAPSKQIFLRATAGVEAYRNGIQHLVGDIPAILEQGIPVLGAISWIRVLDRGAEELWLGTLIPGQFGEVEPRATIQLPDVLGDDIDQITLWAGGRELNLSATFRAVAALTPRLEGPLAKFAGGADRTLADACVGARVVLEEMDGQPVIEAPVIGQ